METKAGETFAGVLASENPASVALKLPGGEIPRWPRESISSLRVSDKSLMPDGLEEGLAVPDMADLLEFLATARP